VASGLLSGVDALERCGVAVDGRLLAVGGGARSTLYRQVLADLAMKEVITLDPAVDRVAVGAAAQAAAVISGTSPDEVGATWAASEKVVVVTEPKIDAAHSAELRERYRLMATRLNR
jgi:xylulokinase